jgi:chromate transporter
VADGVTTPSVASTDYAPPLEPLGKLFVRFLRFGAMAWGGPVAQIAMLKAELVEQERWVSPQRFNRALALYQVLPGPEAQELCVYFGTLARGRMGGFLAGLGFMLPGLLLMLGLSALYLRFGTSSPVVLAAFLGTQAAVAALVVRAVHRIGGHATTNRWLWGVTGTAFVAQLCNAPFAVVLAAAGLAYVFAAGRTRALFILLLVGTLVLAAYAYSTGTAQLLDSSGAAKPLAGAPPLAILWSGLKAGLLTFGGAYTIIPFLRHDAVLVGSWMTDATFLDGLALSGVLPAPMVIFGTFVGYAAGGLLGGVLMTLGIFLPAFGFTLLAHDPLERLLERPQLHRFLEGVTAGVVGLIAATTLKLVRSGVSNVLTAAIFVGALVLLYQGKSRYVTPAVVLGGAAIGLASHWL